MQHNHMTQLNKKPQNSFIVKIWEFTKVSLSQIPSTKIQLHRKEQDRGIIQFPHWGPELIKP